MRIRTILIFLVFSFFMSCTKKVYNFISNKELLSKKLPLIESEKKYWQNLDFEKDTILGVSLNKAYKKFPKNKKQNEIIIAVLDTEFDIEHEAIKNHLWFNTEEIPNNGMDDDKNGYVDDKNGWNFVSNNNGESIINSSYECSRILRYYKNSVILNKQDSVLFKKATLLQGEIDKKYLQQKARIDFYKSVFPRCYKTARKFFPKGNYSSSQIDSLYKLYEKKDDINLYHDLYLLNVLKKSNLDSTWVSENIKSFDYDTKTVYNKDYNEKVITNDNGFDIKDSIYGTNNVSKYAKKTWHGTQVAGLIATTIKKTNVKIMPIVLSGIEGEDNDKDILIAIKYAVNNGAKVINMSSGKHISLHPEWLKEALLYAQKNDVLVITSAGNSAKNIDLEPRYFLDYDENTGNEFCENLIKVAGSSNNLNENLPYIYTNYGIKNADIFAPSYELYVPDAVNGYTFSSGTSLGCAITSGTAALIRSHYPKLSASQVKQIILDSGTAYDMEVIVPGTKDKKVKFSELSKSGKVLNVYNAMKMAKEMSRSKK